MNNYFEKAEKALDYLAESEDEFSRMKAMHQAEKKRMDIVLASLIIESPESSQTAKKSWAEAHTDYSKALNLWEDAMTRYYEIDAKRERACLTIEMYRSWNSQQKKGLMT